MTDELYINGSLVDTEDVEIVRTYKTPFFSDVTQLRNDGTLTIRLPRTARNTAVFEACFRTDFVSDLPYDFLYADYYFNGLPIFLHAEVRILNVDTYIEIQCVYGIDRSSLIALFETKLNEIVPATITDWVIDWRKGNGVSDAMFTSGKKYNFIEYIKGQRTSEQETISGVVQPKLDAPEPYLGHTNEMSWHPFVKAMDIVNLGLDDASIVATFSDLDTRMTNKGLILSELNKYETDEEITITVPTDTYTDAQTFDYDNNDNPYGFWDIEDTIGSMTFGNNCVKKFKDVDVTIVVDFTSDRDGFRILQADGTEYFFASTLSGGQYIYDDTYTFTVKNDASVFQMNFDGIANFTTSGGVIKISYKLQGDFYVVDEYTSLSGKFDCVKNLPKLTTIEFIQQMLIHTGLFIGYDSKGALKTFSLDTFKDYIDDADVVDWTGKVSNIRKSTFQFNSNAQKNYIKFANDKDLNADRKETIEVNDKTLPTERDMYVLEFDSPLGLVDEKSEMILYEQSVKRSGDTGVSFENKYVGDSWNNGFVINDAGVAKNIEAADPTYYTVYKKLVQRPLVLECDVNLSIYESANIDFEKPIYCDEIGRYCLLLELQAPKYDVCVAKLLVVNQKL